MTEGQCYEISDNTDVSSYTAPYIYSSLTASGPCVMTCQQNGHHYYMKKSSDSTSCICSSMAPQGFASGTDCSSKYELKSTGLGHPVIPYDVSGITSPPSSLDLSSNALVDTQALQVIYFIFFLWILFYILQLLEN